MSADDRPEGRREVGAPGFTGALIDPDCGATSPKGYLCTDAAGHDGDHVAGTSIHLVDVWPQEVAR